MADVITRLKLESGEYDSKIKRAVTGLQRMEDECRKVGGTLAILEKDQKEYVQSLGRMQTVSTSVRGKIGELSNAYVELRSQYNRLTQEEKKGDFGKALSASLDQLKTRINDSKQELNDINAELGNTTQSSGGASRALEELAGKFGINVSALTKLGGALAVAGGAVKVATDAFMQNESNVDSWGRTVEATGSIYQSFLQSLNNSDFSGFLSGIGRVIQAAKDAYNAMDELNTRMTIINPERAKLQARQTQLKATIRRKGADSAEGKAAQDELKKMEPQLVKSYQTEAKMNRDAFAAALRQRLAEGNIKVSESEFGALLSTFSDDRKFRQFRANAKGSKGTKVVGSAYSDSQQIIEYDTRNKNQRIADLITDEWRQKYSPYLTASYNAQGQAYSTLLGDARYVKDTKGGTGGTTGGGSGRGGGNTTVRELTEEQKLQQQINDLVQQGMTMDEQGRAAQRVKIAALQDQLQTYKDIENELRGITKQEAKIKPTALDTFANSPISEASINAYLNALQQGIAQSDLGSGIQTALAAKLTEGDQLSQALQMAMDAGVQGADLSEVAQKIKDKMLEGGTMDTEQLQSFLDEINKYIEDSNLKLKFDVDTESITNVAQTNIKDAEKMTQNWQKASSAINTVSSAMQSLEDPAAKVMATIAQAIATIALSYAEASLMAAKNPLNAGWGWIAFAATGAATMMSSIAAIHSATGYAQGGIVDGSNGGFVGGSAFSGDQVGNVRLDSGELVLSRSQQFNLASQLEGDGNQGTTPSRPYVSGEQIYLGLNNYLRRSGRGEIVTSR